MILKKTLWFGKVRYWSLCFDIFGKQGVFKKWKICLFHELCRSLQEKRRTYVGEIPGTAGILFQNRPSQTMAVEYSHCRILSAVIYIMGIWVKYAQYKETLKDSREVYWRDNGDQTIRNTYKRCRSQQWLYSDSNKMFLCIQCLRIQSSIMLRNKRKCIMYRETLSVNFLNLR